jgi:hypothetical protein
MWGVYTSCRICHRKEEFTGATNRMDIKELIQIIVWLAGIASFLFGVYQYRQAQIWKRLEYAANQIQRLTSSPDLILAISFLEYSKMKIPLPEKYRKIANEAEIFNHDCDKLSKIMESEYFEETAEYFIYREAFARQFEYLEQIYQFIEMKLIQADDVKGIKWVLENIAAPRFINKTVLIKHLQGDFKNVIRLMNLMGIQIV